jgi:hypothetical protein
MKILNRLFKISFCIYLLFALQAKANCQDADKPVVKKPFVTLKYFNLQGQMQYLLFQGQLKADKKLEPISNLAVKVYLDDETDEKNFIGQVKTDQLGKANLLVPTSIKDNWIKSNQHKFIAVTDSIPGIGVRQAESEISISRMSIDTVADSDSRKVIVRFESKKDTQWIPVKDIEIKLGVKRHGSQLALGESETVTTDSSGTATTDFTKDSLPGDAMGNIILIAKLEDNDTYGNVVAERSVSWGKAFHDQNNFWKRSLWATGPRVPIWLLSIACLIIFSVWGTLIYLISRILKIRKLGVN